MTTATTSPGATAPAVHTDAQLLERSWKVPIGLGVFALVAIILFVVLGRDGQSVFSFTASNANAVQLPTLPLGARATGIVVSVIAVLMAAGAAVLVQRRVHVPLWYVAIYTLTLVIGFLVWTTTGNTLHITGLLVGSLALSAPLIFGALGGVISERVGVTNVAIEGQLLAGAFVSAVTASVTGSLVAGVIAAMVAGVLVSFVLGAFAVKYAVNQVIVGIVLNVLVLGLTTFLYQTVLVNNQTTLNTPPRFHNIDIPLLSQIPVIGPLLFSQTVIVYLMYIAVIAIFVGLFRTRWGLRLRAVGEHPQAADTVGINVARTRFWNVALAGAIVGLGGAYFTLGSVGPFSQNMTNGNGFIALAAVIFGRWDPIRATLAALLFGFASNLQSVISILGSPVPNDFLLMLPYVVTIFAVAGVVGRVRGPAAAGRPYVKS
ncbi:ABC transporter permease [Galbitalea soli]|uniref:ABC transporter permease n=1 Tax=Galbitalea soli TaxID=1268042 RepID=A0A7C9TR13_9MICO|nr:ABC transporter permease [Galbitalea soli]NEM91301.1 ABC transporter permease [Galbitalea soli]NYJ29990.1 simple sugar transport system permease protein [Galbitalea soli]